LPVPHGVFHSARPVLLFPPFAFHSGKSSTMQFSPPRFSRFLQQITWEPQGGLDMVSSFEDLCRVAGSEVFISFPSPDDLPDRSVPFLLPRFRPLPLLSPRGLASGRDLYFLVLCPAGEKTVLGLANLRLGGAFYFFFSLSEPLDSLDRKAIRCPQANQPFFLFIPFASRVDVSFLCSMGCRGAHHMVLAPSASIGASLNTVHFG